MLDRGIAEENARLIDQAEPEAGIPRVVQLPNIPDDILSTDSPRKRVVRSDWDTPLLKAIYEQLGISYIYCGLPGPEVIDIRLWQPMIRRVIAFQAEDERGANRRRTLIALNRNLQILGYAGDVYCGYMENVILLGSDLDGTAYEPDEFITLFNLDFCDTITSLVPTGQGHKCRRFDALREIMASQRRLYSATRESRFILLLTVREEFHRFQMARFTLSQDLPAATAWYLRELPPPQPACRGMQRSAAHLKAFVFTTLRTYCRANNVSTFFLPPVKYVGRSDNSNMLHFVVLCRCYPTEEALPGERQSPGDFLRRASCRATNVDIISEPCGDWETNRSQMSTVDTSIRFLR